MSRLFISGALGLFALIAVGVGVAVSQDAPLDPQRGPTLTRFASADAFQRYLRTVQSQRRHSEVMNDTADMAMEAAPSPMAAQAGAEPANPEITNNQTVGVDEGGIVKQIGDYLVVLQDGRLFSADLGEHEGAPLSLADRIDVYRSPDTAASWYDEMLVLGDRILVTAYNYRERASEITVVRMARDGRFAREGRFLLSSNDYYSTDNYATRLVGDQLVFYAPLALDAGPRGDFTWPRLRRADGDGDADEGEALIGPTDVYAAPGEVDYPVLHTISVCPLRRGMDCRTTAFIGPAMREMYVSPTDAFLWIGAPDGLPWDIDYGNWRRHSCPSGETWQEGAAQSALLYRLPLNGGEVGAVAVDGVPSDQFAFDSRDGRFRALLARPGAGCVKPDENRSLALLDIPLSAFGQSIRHVADNAYAAVPGIAAGELENRFVGNWLVYGGRTSWSSMPEGERGPTESSLVAVPLANPAAAARLPLSHNAIRIERAGNDAVVTGYRDSSGLSLSYVTLGRGQARLTATTMLPRRFESEGRSHAFNAWVRADGSGLIGIPTTYSEGRSIRGWSDSQSSELSFIAVAPNRLTPAGELGGARREAAGDYRCEVSCIDWYGNSRPIFTGGRIFALMGTDLVEGRIERGRIAELARLELTGPVGEVGKLATR